MYANRMAYVVIYFGKQVPNVLSTMPVDVSYISKKQNYAIFYGDRAQENQYKNKLKDVKGFKFFGISLLYDENLNF